jgi:hypothetical protein
MKISLILTSIIFSAIASAANSSQIGMVCKTGFKEVARCAAQEFLGSNSGDKFSDDIARAVISAYQDIMVCQGRGKPYVQMNIPDENGKPDVSPEIPATLKTSGPTSTVRFDLDEGSWMTLVYGGLAGGKYNARLSNSVKNGSKTISFNYSAQCIYKR